MTFDDLGGAFLDPTDFGTDYEAKAPSALTSAELDGATGATPSGGGSLNAVSRNGDLYDGPAATEIILAYPTVADAEEAFASTRDGDHTAGPRADGDTFEEELSLRRSGDEMVAYRASHEGDSSDPSLAGRQVLVDTTIARVGAIIITLDVRGTEVTTAFDQQMIDLAVQKVARTLGR